MVRVNRPIAVLPLIPTSAPVIRVRAGSGMVPSGAVREEFHPYGLLHVDIFGDLRPCTRLLCRIRTRWRPWDPQGGHRLPLGVRLLSTPQTSPVPRPGEERPLRTTSPGPHEVIHERRTAGLELLVLHDQPPGALPPSGVTPIVPDPAARTRSGPPPSQGGGSALCPKHPQMPSGTSVNVHRFLDFH